MSRRAGGGGAILLVFLLACSSREKPPPVNRARVEQLEKLEWHSPPGGDGAAVLGLASVALGDASAEVRKRAAGFLARKRPAGGGALLLERLALEEGSPVRRELVSALSGFSTPLARAELRRIAAGDEDPGLRALALGRLGELEADRDILRKALASSLEAERLGAALALVRHPLRSQAAAVARALEQEQVERVRWVLAEALGLCSRGAGEDLPGEFCSLLL
ncbi:MAG: HEAT repeat domain-containing protein, partial [Planctomycetota bacterium]|nr:HEAT repeat domain-containing protein [Planctomycetota bacterium]